MFLNDRLLICPSLVCNCCVCVFSFLLFDMQVFLYRQLYRPIHARLIFIKYQYQYRVVASLPYPTSYEIFYTHINF